MSDVPNLNEELRHGPQLPNAWPFARSVQPNYLGQDAAEPVQNQEEDWPTDPESAHSPETDASNMQDERLTLHVRQCMARMAVATVLWPGINRTELGRVGRATLQRSSSTFIIGALSHVLDLADLKRHTCSPGGLEGGERALVQRVCLRSLVPGPHHNYAYVPAPQLSEIARQPVGTTPWLDTALGQLAEVNFMPENLAEIVERQGKIEFLAAQ